MSDIFFKIDQLKNQFTIKEQKIVQLILSNPKIVIKSNIQELAELSSTSTAAWNRFAKKIGYKGVVEVKVELASELNKETSTNEFDTWLDGNESIDELIHKYQKIFNNSINDTVKIINKQSVDKAIKEINSANRVYIFGVGASSVIAYDFLQKITRIGKTGIFYPDMHMFLTNLSNINDKDVLVTISYSGETPETIFGAKLAKDNGAKVISICGNNRNSTLSKISDNVLYVPLGEKELRVGAISSRNATLFLTDILYLGLTNMNYKNSITKLKYSYSKANSLKKGK